jgi:uncharacterized protein
MFSAFAPAGRMALTNYLAQTIVGLLIFYGLLGYGAMRAGTVGPAAVVALTVVVFGFQAAFSAAWLRVFRFGPAEWVWRSLVYGAPQPLFRGFTVAPRVGDR